MQLQSTSEILYTEPNRLMPATDSEEPSLATARKLIEEPIDVQFRMEPHC
jgi:hypothetical protein